MRLVGVTTFNIGGLPDGTVTLPGGPVAAFAGGNGTGKSKLLACLLTLWTGQMPSPRAELQAEVAVEARLTADERQGLEAYSRLVGWGEASVPELVRIGLRHTPAIGTQRFSEPQITVLENAFQQQPLVSDHPGLNVVYLPAERRLMPPQQQGIDLAQLSEVVAWQRTVEPRSAVQNYGRLDDAEFETFAKALCVAASLPSEGISTRGDATEANVAWDSFRATVNGLLAPKELLPLTREHPENLRIQTLNGETHPVQDLSSGERQALIIISRVLRAGAGHALVLIDEPDAYLHPHLSQRLYQALAAGVGEDGQLVVATHSPAILDSMEPSQIVRLSHDSLPRVVADEGERLDLYRDAGFRASALTQSDLLMVVEGDSDGPLLSLLIPELARASIRHAGGRARVLREVEQLAPYELPVLGVVDRDVMAPAIDGVLAELVAVWPTADIEGVMLSDDLTLEVMVANGLVKSDLGVEQLRSTLQDLVLAQRENVVAELAQRRLRDAASLTWPSPKGPNPLARLRDAVAAMGPLGGDQLDDCVAWGEAEWESHDDETRWQLVRGKYILNQFAALASEMRSGRALLEAVARHRPPLAAIALVRDRIEQRLP